MKFTNIRLECLDLSNGKKAMDQCHYIYKATQKQAKLRNL